MVLKFNRPEVSEADTQKTKRGKSLEKCPICQGKTPIKYRKISPPEQEISLYESIFSKKVSQLTN